MVTTHNIFTDADRRKFLKLLRKNEGHLTKTCKQMGIRGGASTIKKWKEKHEWFKEELELFVDEQLTQIDDNASELAIKEKHPALIKFFLQCHPRAKELFGYTNKTEVTGKDGKPLICVQDMME